VGDLDAAVRQIVCLKIVAYGYETQYPCTQVPDHPGECTFKGKTKAELEAEED